MGARARRRRIEAILAGDVQVCREEAAAYAAWSARGGDPPLIQRIAAELGIPASEVAEAVSAQLQIDDRS